MQVLELPASKQDAVDQALSKVPEDHLALSVEELAATDDMLVTFDACMYSISSNCCSDDSQVMTLIGALTADNSLDAAKV